MPTRPTKPSRRSLRLDSARSESMAEDRSGSMERRGTAVSPGLGMGPAYVVDRRHVNGPHTSIDREQVEPEIKRFRTALRAAHDQLETIKGRLSQGEHRQILKAQQLMLRDPALVQRTETLIKDDLINAE